MVCGIRRDVYNCTAVCCLKKGGLNDGTKFFFIFFKCRRLLKNQKKCQYNIINFF